jgi:hypothetical protein
MVHEDREYYLIVSKQGLTVVLVTSSPPSIIQVVILPITSGGSTLMMQSITQPGTVAATLTHGTYYVVSLPNRTNPLVHTGRPSVQTLLVLAPNIYRLLQEHYPL